MDTRSLSPGRDKLRIFIAGHNGMVGSALNQQLNGVKDIQVVTATRRELDLLDQAAVHGFFTEHKFDEVYLAAAKVGGIHANKTYPAEFIYENLVVQNNIIHAAHLCDINKLLFLGSSCIYPKFSEQPIKEDALLTGALEPTNEPYAIAKIAGLTLCDAYNKQYQRDYRSVMPTNLYGPNDNFHPQNSHVIPGLIDKFDKAISAGAQSVTLWGTGNPRREFLHVSDMAAGSIHVMNLSSDAYKSALRTGCNHLNVGTGEDCKIRELAEHIATISGFSGELVFDSSQPDGTPRKLLDVSALHTSGWQHEIALDSGLKQTWDWFQAHRESLRIH